VGSHTYAAAGPFKITVTVHDDSGFTVAATTQAFDPPTTPAGPLHHRSHGVARRQKTGHVSPHHKDVAPGHAASIRKTTKPRPNGNVRS
jgi:hypothetical protein